MLLLIVLVKFRCCRFARRSDRSSFAIIVPRRCDIRWLCRNLHGSLDITVTALPREIENYANIISDNSVLVNRRPPPKKRWRGDVRSRGVRHYRKTVAGVLEVNLRYASLLNSHSTFPRPRRRNTLNQLPPPPPLVPFPRPLRFPFANFSRNFPLKLR